AFGEFVSFDYYHIYPYECRLYLCIIFIVVSCFFFAFLMNLFGMYPNAALFFLALFGSLSSFTLFSSIVLISFLLFSSSFGSVFVAYAIFRIFPSFWFFVPFRSCGFSPKVWSHFSSCHLCTNCIIFFFLFLFF